jgi:hypothetical protein
MSPQKKSKIEKLRDKLYSAKSKGLNLRPRAPIYEEDHQVSDSWKEEKSAPVKKKTRMSLLGNSVFRRFFIGAIVFFVLAIGFGLFTFFNGINTVSSDNIDIEVLGNAFVSGGEELPLKIQLSNRNNVPLEYCDLFLQYQKGAGNGESIQSDRVTVGMIPSGGVVEKLINLTLFGSQGTTRDVNITLEYRVKGSSAIFTKQKPYVVNIASTPINLVVDGPSVTNSNQDISFNVTTSLNTENTAKDMLLVVHYPPGFDFKSANPAPTFSNNIWSFGDMSKGAEKVVTIDGVLVADPGEDRAFNITTGSKDPENEQRIGTQFNAEDYIVSIQKPFLDLRLAVNGDEDPETSASASQSSKGEITLSNDFDSKMTDIEISAKFSGNAFDNTKVTQAGGFYDSATQTIVWNSQTKEDLKSFDPGDKQTLTFGFQPMDLSKSNLKNPEIDISISVKGRQQALGGLFQSIDDYVKKKVKYGTSLAITSNTLYYSGPLVNSGPIPPTPGVPTTYTVVWNVANTINKVTDTKIKTSLPTYVDWVGKFSPSSADVTYNAVTKEITWNVGSVDAGVGLVSSPKQLYFQVRLNPSASQTGTTPKLTSDTVIWSKDSFTGSDLSSSIQPADTRLNLDSNYNSQNDRVR